MRWLVLTPLFICRIVGLFGQPPATTTATSGNFVKHSGQMLSVIKKEIQIKKLTTFNISKSEKEKLFDFMAVANNRDRFLKQIDSAVKVAKGSTYMDQWYLKNKLPKPVVREFQKTYRENSLGEYWNVTLSPIVADGVQSYAADFVTSYYDQNREQVIKLADKLIQTFRRKGIEVNVNNPDSLSAVIEKFLDDNLIELKNNLIIPALAGQVINNIKSKTSASISGTATIAQFKTHFNGEVRNLSTAMDQHFKEIGEGMLELSRNEEQVRSTINQWTLQVEQRAKEIQGLEKRIEGIIRSKGNDVQKRVADLQAQHATLLNQNLAQIQVINTYVQKGVAIVEQIPKFKEQFENAFAAGSKAINELQNFKTPTLSGVLTYASQTVQAVGGVADAISELTGNSAAAKKVATFTRYAVAGIQVLTSLFPPNPIGIISGLAGLFGGGGPDPQQQMMQQMMDQIEQGFSDLHKRLDVIEEKIDALDKTVREFYVDAMRSFAIIRNQLSVLEYKLEVIEGLSRFQVYNDYYMVYGFFNENIYNDSKRVLAYFNSGIAGYYELTNSLAAKDRLTTLFEQVVHLSEPKFKSLAHDKYYLDSKSLEFKVRDTAFQATKALFLKYYPSYNFQKGIVNTIMLPPEFIDIGYTNEVISVVGQRPFMDANFSESYRYNDIFLASITKIFIDAIPVFVMSYTDQVGLIDNNLEDFMKRDVQFRYTDVLIGLKKILCTTNEAIFQEIILAGHPYLNQLYSSLFSTRTEATIALLALNKNDVLSKNMITYILHSSLKGINAERFKQECNNYYTQRVSPDSANAIVNRINRLGARQVGNTGYKIIPSTVDGNLYFDFKSPDGSWSGILPSPEIIYEGKMLYSDSFYNLAYVKDAVLNEIFDIEFPQALSAENKHIVNTLIKLDSSD